MLRLLLQVVPVIIRIFFRAILAEGSLEQARNVVPVASSSSMCTLIRQALLERVVILYPIETFQAHIRSVQQPCRAAMAHPLLQAFSHVVIDIFRKHQSLIVDLQAVAPLEILRSGK